VIFSSSISSREKDQQNLSGKLLAMPSIFMRLSHEAPPQLLPPHKPPLLMRLLKSPPFIELPLLPLLCLHNITSEDRTSNPLHDVGTKNKNIPGENCNIEGFELPPPPPPPPCSREEIA
jgi:hypothetical protein